MKRDALISMLVCACCLAAFVSGASDTPQTGKEYRPDGTKGSPMVYVPAGEFTMGSSSAQMEEAFQLCKKYFMACKKEWFEDEGPQHKVYLGEFYIDKYEVTLDQYAPCVSSGKCAETMTHELCNWGKSGRGNHPINCLEWEEAGAYCEWAGKRLPTEAEWEKAARGTDGRIFPWGNEWNKRNANFCDSSCNMSWKDSGYKDGYATTSPVGSYPGGSSPCGTMDMAGNVLEWTADWYSDKYYSDSPSRNPEGPANGEYHVLRGGSWLRYPSALRASFRGSGSTPTKYRVGGVRCAMTP